MHELSIAQSLVEVALEALTDHAQGQRVSAVHLRLGALAGVDVQALLFSYDLVTEDTPLAGSVLQIERVPVRIFCPSCKVEREVVSPASLSCPECGERSGDIRAGRELEVFALDLADPDEADTDRMLPGSPALEEHHP